MRPNNPACQEQKITTGCPVRADRRWRAAIFDVHMLLRVNNKAEAAQPSVEDFETAGGRAGGTGFFRRWQMRYCSSLGMRWWR